MNAVSPQAQRDVLFFCQSGPKILQELVTLLRKRNSTMPQSDVLMLLNIMVNHGYLRKISERRFFPKEQLNGTYVVTLYESTDLGNKNTSG